MYIILYFSRRTNTVLRCKQCSCHIYLQCTRIVSQLSSHKHDMVRCVEYLLSLYECYVETRSNIYPVYLLLQSHDGSVLISICVLFSSAQNRGFVKSVDLCARITMINTTTSRSEGSYTIVHVENIIEYKRRSE